MMSPCSQGGDASPKSGAEAAEDVQAITASAATILTEAQLDSYSKKALLGDGEAAFSIYLHYNFGLDLRNGDFWLRIAAENGDFSGMLVYAYVLLDIPRREECLRALYWVKRAEAAANSETERTAVQEKMEIVRKKCPWIKHD